MDEWMGGWMYMSMNERVLICADTLSLLFVFLSFHHFLLPSFPPPIISSSLPPITPSPLPLGTGGANLHGMGFYLALNALNFAEADRPFRKLCNEQQLSEMFFSLGLQCHFSLPYGSTLPMV